MVSVIQYSPKFHIVNLLKRFGTSYKIFMREIQKSKKQSFKLIEVSSNKKNEGR